MNLTRITPEDEVTIHLSGKDYIKNQPVQLEEVLVIIDEAKSTGVLATLEIDLSGMNILHLDVRGLLMLIRDIYDYTKNRGFLKEIKIKGTGFVFRNLWRPTSLILPRSVRDLVKLC